MERRNFGAPISTGPGRNRNPYAVAGKTTTTPCVPPKPKRSLLGREKQASTPDAKSGILGRLRGRGKAA
jgi:hypothetical protein